MSTFRTINTLCLLAALPLVAHGLPFHSSSTFSRRDLGALADVSTSTCRVRGVDIPDPALALYQLNCGDKSILSSMHVDPDDDVAIQSVCSELSDCVQNSHSSVTPALPLSQGVSGTPLGSTAGAVGGATGLSPAGDAAAAAPNLPTGQGVADDTWLSPGGDIISTTLGLPTGQGVSGSPLGAAADSGVGDAGLLPGGDDISAWLDLPIGQGTPSTPLGATPGIAAGDVDPPVTDDLTPGSPCESTPGAAIGDVHSPTDGGIFTPPLRPDGDVIGDAVVSPSDTNAVVGETITSPVGDISPSTYAGIPVGNGVGDGTLPVSPLGLGADVTDGTVGADVISDDGLASIPSATLGEAAGAAGDLVPTTIGDDEPTTGDDQSSGSTPSVVDDAWNTIDNVQPCDCTDEIIETLESDVHNDIGTLASSIASNAAPVAPISAY